MDRRKQARELAVKVLEEHGHQIVRVLREHEDAMDGNTAARPENLVALMEIYAARLDAVRDGSITELIDSRMGAGWCRSLADALEARPTQGTSK